MSGEAIFLVTIFIMIITAVLYMKTREKKQEKKIRIAFDRLSKCDQIIYEVKSTKKPGQISITNIYEIEKETDPIRREVYGAAGLREERIQNMQCQRNMIGEELETENRIEEAIVLYEENVRTRADTPHCYTRLAIIYRSRKQYDNEIKILKMALKRFPNSSDYSKRLAKARALKATADSPDMVEKDEEETKKS